MTKVRNSGSEAVALGAEMRRLRRERGLSQRAFTRMLGLSAHSNLADYEAGRRIPPRDILRECATILADRDGRLSELHTRALAERAAPVPAHVPAGTQVGLVGLRYSANCRAAWSTFEPLLVPVTDQPITVTVMSHRPVDGVRLVFEVSTVEQAYGGPLPAEPGGVEATAAVTFGVTQVTGATASGCPT